MNSNSTGENYEDREPKKETTLQHFVAPLILAELLHLSLADRVIFEESKVVSGGAYGDISKGSCDWTGRGKVEVAIKRLRFYMKEDIKLVSILTFYH